jgi:hypothetical protein
MPELPEEDDDRAAFIYIGRYIKIKLLHHDAASSATD